MRNKIFISYSHKDELYKSNLKTHLKPFELLAEIEEWDDTKLAVGENFHNQIHQIIEETAVAILLVSKDYLASRFIVHKELIPLLEAWKKNEVKIIPIILNPCVYTEIDLLKNMQAINDPREPLCNFSAAQQDEVWVKAASMARYELNKHASDAEREVPSAHHLIQTPHVHPQELFYARIGHNDFLVPDKCGWYHAAIAEIRSNVPNEYRCYLLNKRIYIKDHRPVENETHWLFYKAERFIDLSVGDKIMFKISQINELKNWNDGLSNTRNIYISELYLDAQRRSY